MSRSYLFVTAICAVAIAAPALAGEVNGSTKNPKSKFSQGASLCKFSGLNDNPDSTNPANPGGRTQSYGTSVTLGLFDPSDPDERDSFFFPGTGCNPTSDVGPE
jgi:hypothetical protein